MPTLLRLSCLLALILFLNQNIYSQTGPGGVGNSSGASSQPQNVLWLKSDAGISTSGGFVDGWLDQSGNNNHATATGGTRPTYTGSDTDFNNLSSVNFLNTAASNFFLRVADNDNLDNTDQLTVFVVLRPTSNVPNTTLGLLSKRTASNTDQSYYFALTTNPRYQVVVGTAAASNLNGTNNTALNQNDIIAFVMNAGTKNGYRDGSAVGTVTGDNLIANNTSDLFIGTYDANTNTGLEGSIVEVIIYRTALNAAQRQIVENYLSAKYSTALTTGDIYGGDVAGGSTLNHDFDVVGIGQASGTQHLLANSKGLILSPSSGTINNNGEFLVIGHNGLANSAVTTNLGSGGVVQRWNRTWYFDEAGTFDATITFDFSEGVNGDFPQNKDNYVLLRRNTGTGNYDVVAINNTNKSISGDQITFVVPDASLTDGVYTLGTLDLTNSPVTGLSNKTWYSYQSGNWEDPQSWTLDGGLFPLFVNPGNNIPGPSDNVVIGSGKTITINNNNVLISSLQLIGTLDIGISTGHNFIDISGAGLLRMSGANDNFPAGDVTDFADQVVGGTVEIGGTGMILNVVRTFNNLEINLTGSNDLVNLQTNLTLNGNFKINNGLFTFNNDVTVANRIMTVFGDVEVASSGGIRVGTGNNSNTRHEFNLYGDFINDGGTAYFTNRVSATYGSEASNGIVDFNTLSATQDQEIECNGVTRFYRIEISKGTNDSYKTSLSANNTANFNLFGFANEDHGSVTQLTTNANALGLIYGTVEIKENVVIPVLSTASNYNISEGAQIWINGGTLNKNSGNSLVPYGKVRVSDGTLTANVVAGITTREDGAIIIEGGTVTTNQIRTSVEGPTNIGSYIQSGGTVTVNGDGPGGTGLQYYVFSLSYPGNVFNMSGGDLIVKGTRGGTDGTRGAIFINSDPANISVTGGRVIFEISNNNSYKVTSRAPFWNVLMRRTAGTATVVELNSGDTGSGGSFTSLPIQPLVVLNDLTVESPVNFITNSADVTVGGNIDLNNGSTYTHGTNTTTINGEGVSSLIFGNTSLTQTFNNLIIDKENITDEVLIATGNATALRVNGALTINNGLFNYNSFIVSTRGTVTIASGLTVGKSTSTGRLLFDGTVAQTFNSVGATIYNLQLNNTGASPQVTLANGDLTILGTLTMTSGVFSIGVNKLSLNSSTSVLAGSPFSATKMIQTSGLSSDGGLELYVGGNGAIDYPLGVAGKYAPARPQFQSFSDNGLVRIVPVDAVLQTTAGAQSILSFYWKVSYSNFTTLPTVSYQFRYDQADVDANENQYVAGKVTDFPPYDRIQDPNTGGVDNVDEGNNLIVFNGTSNGLTFPGAGFTLEAANYTAARTSRFNGVLDTYYSVASGDWNTGSTWSRNATSGGPPNVPTAGSIVVIQSSGGNGHRVNVLTGTVSVAALQFDATGVVSPNPETVPRLQFYAAGTNNLGFVTGAGMISFDAPDAPVVNGDFNDFGTNPNSYYLYFGGNATLTTIPTPIPNLMFESATYTVNQNITVNSDLIVQGNAVVRPLQAVAIKRDLVLGYWLGGTFQLPGAAPAITVTIDRNIDYTQDPFSNPGNRIVNVNNPGVATVENTIIVKGDIIQGASNNSVLDLYNGAANRPLANLEFHGTGNNSYTRSSTSVPDLNRIVCNKGSDLSSGFFINGSVVLNALSNSAIKPITLTNGLLTLNNPGTYVLTSGGGDFTIPGTAGLDVNGSTVSITTTNTNANVILDGLLRVTTGTVTLDAGVGFANYIEYSNSGNATIEVLGGSLTVGGQVRRGLSSTTGILKYTQSGGNVAVGNRGATTAIRGVFEVLNTGSQFNHTGGNFTIVNGINSTTVPSLWLEPETFSIGTGSLITIGNTSTIAGVTAQNIGIKSSVPLYNLTIAGSNSPVAKIYTLPLIVSNDLTISSSTTLNAQGINLTIGRNFTVDGSYVNGNNLTTFTNAGAAAVSGVTSALSFYNFTKSGAGTLTVNKDITINRDLVLSAGSINTGASLINLRRHATIDGSLTATSGEGLIFNGSTQQLLQRSGSGTGTLGIVTVNNSSGVIIPDGNGFNFTITDGLRLERGVLDIGGSLLFLTQNAFITPVNPFSVTNMIQTNSSFTDFGVRKQFPLNYTTNFTFPVGQLSYTPVVFDFSSPSNTTGSSGTPTITVRPANERHPSIVNDLEAPDPEIDDLQNALQYHWIVNADNVASTFRSSMACTYQQSLVSVTAPQTEADYIAARILSDANPTLSINKFSTLEVDENANTVTFAFTGVTDSGISGDYFAGVDLAIPNNVPIYTTNGSGNFTTAIYTPLVPGGGAPVGAAVIVRPGDELVLSANGASFYSTQINGTVTINSGTIGHRLGYVSGTGNLRIDSNTSSIAVPAAVYDDFFSCSGGGLIFGGSGSYEILGGITSLRNLTIEGGTRTMGNNDLIICNDFTISSGSFSNVRSRTITVQNDVLITGGTYLNFQGVLNVTRDLISAGTFFGGGGGAKSIGRNLIISGGTFTGGSGSSNIIAVSGNMSVADAATFTGGTVAAGGMRFSFNGTGQQSLSGNFTNTLGRALNRLAIDNSGAGLIITNNTDVVSQLILTNGLITPQAILTMLGSASAVPTAGSANSYVSGKLYKVITTDGSSFTFPIGKGGRWRSGSIVAASVGGVTWDMEYFTGSAVGQVAAAPAPRSNPVNNLTSSDPLILTIATGEYWKVSDGSATSNGRTARVGLSWGTESDVSSNTTFQQALTVMSWNGTNWTNNGGQSFPGGNTQARGTFESSSTLSFSENIVTLGSTEAANPLPVELTTFTGRNENGFNKIKWSTASELNNDYFELQRSANGETFTTMGIIQGKGTTSALSNYLFDDEAPLVGNNYYRLKQVDYNGAFEYSHIILVKNDSEAAVFNISVFPNPLAEGTALTIRSIKDNEHEAQVVIRDMTGRVLTSYSIGSETFAERTVDTATWSGAGIYIVEMTQGKKRVLRRVVVD
ncbi:LamG-like jellyroll fold domain-containing protein [Chryseotalea sanaruensis]|nr:LamG-like jellyroll fold domain-containing protein [Chryseotalea sanaruensis]